MNGQLADTTQPLLSNPAAPFSLQNTRRTHRELQSRRTRSTPI